MVARSKSLTYDDLQRLRETRDERLELIAGELIVTPSPTPLHQRVSSRLNDLLITESAFEGVPDYIIEIGSPSLDRHDREIKRALYARHSVPE